MSGKGEVPEYSRQDLRKSTRFVEGDYKGINPREFYRRLKRRLEEVQTANDFKYETRGVQDRDLQIKSEQVGEKTGRVDGRLAAESDWEFIGNGSLEYRPYGPHGALGILVGVLVTLAGGLSNEMAIAGVGILGVLVGGYYYFQTDTHGFPVVRKDAIRVLITGEVSERTIEDDDERRTDIFANMSVIYAGDTFVNVYSDNLDELPWTFREELLRQVKRWHNKIVVQDQRLEVNDGFLAHLSSWSNRSLEGDRQTLESIQQALNESFDVRLEYTDELLEQLPSDVQDELSEQQDALRGELEDLAEEMDVYVEREGLEQTA
ncbi:hypothetical protein [Halobacterium bonnevillei]|uniref:Uncharacterized protein n=1 Tax=Halobacterium bonnevillei TaxID=2692200 RepID=A0A6B0SKE2_9EURY|nr:hypothetical protein [Halobacterium bonnevillei]MXR19362.1 hypothetical protein [Halobacterium bonnevillei]